MYLDDEQEEAFPEVEEEAEEEDMSFSLEATADAVCCCCSCCCCCWRCCSWLDLFAEVAAAASEAEGDSPFLRKRSLDLSEPTSLVAGEIDMAEAGLTEGDTASTPQPTTRSESVSELCEALEEDPEVREFSLRLEDTPLRLSMSASVSVTFSFPSPLSSIRLPSSSPASSSSSLGLPQCVCGRAGGSACSVGVGARRRGAGRSEEGSRRRTWRACAAWSAAL